MKRLFWALLLLLVSACAPSPQACSRPQVVCAALLLGEWQENSTLATQSWQALEEARQQHLVTATWRIVLTDSRDRERNLRWTAEEGMDVVVTVSSSWAEVTQSVAQAFPNTHFIGIDQPVAPFPNFTAISLPYDQLGFLAGALAANLTQTRRVAALCEEAFIPAMWRGCEGFVRGVRYTDQRVFVYRQYRQGSPELLFQDEQWGKEAAARVVRQGADVIFALGGRTAQAALLQAAAQRALVIGAEEDLFPLLPPLRSQWVGAPLPEVRSVLLELLQNAAQGGTWPALRPARLQWAPFRGYGEQIPLSLRVEMELLRLNLQEGKVRSGVP